MFISIKANKISEQIITQIRQAILAEKLRPGDRLPPEKELMANFKVSKGTLREALLSLETLGLLEIRKGALGGAYVTEVDIKKAGEFFLNFLYFKSVALSNLTEVRILVEAYIAEKAALMLGREDLKKLKELNEEFEEQLGQNLPAESFNRQIEFHRILGEATGNPILIFFLDFISNTVIAAKNVLKPQMDFYHSVLKAHKQIFDAVREKNPKKAREAMIKHIKEEEKDLFDIQKKGAVENLDLRQDLFRNLMNSKGWEV